MFSRQKSLSVVFSALLLTAGLSTVLFTTQEPAHADPSPRPAPGCQGAPADPEAFFEHDGDLCPDDGSEAFSVNVDGDVGSGATVTIATDAAPCDHQDATTDIYSPDGCYSEMDFIVQSDICAYLDTYDEGVSRSRTFFGSPYKLCGGYTSEELPCNMVYGTGRCGSVAFKMKLEADQCNPYFSPVYAEGGPAGTDQVWAIRGPASLSCTFDRETETDGISSEPNGLYGPTWIRGMASMKIRYADGSSGDLGSVFWLPVDGTERPRPPHAEFDERKLALPN